MLTSPELLRTSSSLPHVSPCHLAVEEMEIELYSLYFLGLSFLASEVLVHGVSLDTSICLDVAANDRHLRKV